jgi:hypothetical protein
MKPVPATDAVYSSSTAPAVPKPFNREALQRDINVLHEHIGVKQLIECRNNREIRALHTAAQFDNDGMDKLSAEIVVTAISSHPDPLFNPTAPISKTWPAEDMLSHAAASLALLTASIDDASVRAIVVRSLVPEDAYDVDRLYRLTHWLLSRIPNHLSIPDARSLPGDLYGALARWASSGRVAPSPGSPGSPGSTLAASVVSAALEEQVSSGKLLIIQVRKVTSAPPALDPTRGYVYHGSNMGNWLSIADKGIKLLSNTRHMVHGAVHGAGIYVTPSFPTAYHYSSGAAATRGVTICASMSSPHDIRYGVNRCGFVTVGLCRAVLSDLRTPSGVPDASIRVCHSESDLSLDYIAVMCPTNRPYSLPTGNH